MGYAQETGYTPTSVATIMSDIMAKINVQFNLDPAYTMETFVGTNAYKYFYALAQKANENEIKTAEIFQKLQNYFDQINARVSRPVTTQPGTIELIEDEGYQSSVKAMVEADAGKRSVCVDVDDGTHATGKITITSYANLVSGTDDKVTIGTTDFTFQTGSVTPGGGTAQAATSNAATAASLASQINAHATASTKVRAKAIGSTVHLKAVQGGMTGNNIVCSYTENDSNIGLTLAGLVGGKLSGGVTNDDYAAIKAEIGLLLSQSTVGGVVTQGTEVQSITISNGQTFDYKYFLPNKRAPWLRLTVTLSENNQVVVGTPDEIKQKLLANVLSRYRLGRNFEPQRYYSVVDAPWAASVLLEYSLNYDPDDAGSATWSSAVYDAAFDDYFDVDLERIILVEA